MLLYVNCQSAADSFTSSKNFNQGDIVIHIASQSFIKLVWGKVQTHQNEQIGDRCFSSKFSPK